MSPLFVVISSETLGKGEDDLGRLLMGNFLKALGEEERRPTAIFLMHRAVLLATGKSDAVELLEYLRDRGVVILLCRTCVEYYGVREMVSVGEISGMQRLVEMVSTGRAVFI